MQILDFCISASNKKRRNHVGFFKNEHGCWVDKHNGLLTYTPNYFHTIFLTSYAQTDWHHISASTTSFDNVDL